MFTQLATSAILLPALLSSTAFAAPMPVNVHRRALADGILAQQHANLFAQLRFPGRDTAPCFDFGYAAGDEACVDGIPSTCSLDGAWEAIQDCSLQDPTLKCFPIPKEGSVEITCAKEADFRRALVDSGFQGDVGNSQVPPAAQLVKKVTGLNRNGEENDEGANEDAPIECPAPIDEDEDVADAPDSPGATAPIEIIPTSIGSVFDPPTSTSLAAAPTLETTDAATPTEVPENAAPAPPENTEQAAITVTVIIAPELTTTLTPVPTVTQTLSFTALPPPEVTESVSAPSSAVETVTTTDETVSSPTSTFAVITDDPEAIETALSSSTVSSSSASATITIRPDVGEGGVTFINTEDLASSTSSSASVSFTAPAANAPDVARPPSVTFIPLAPTDNAQVVGDIQDGYY